MINKQEGIILNLCFRELLCRPRELGLARTVLENTYMGNPWLSYLMPNNHRRDVHSNPWRSRLQNSVCFGSIIIIKKIKLLETSRQSSPWLIGAFFFGLVLTPVLLSLLDSFQVGFQFSLFAYLGSFLS